MSNVCDFRITIKGPESKLVEPTTFLPSALEECRGGIYGNFVLHIDRLWPDIDEDRDHTFVGLNDYREEGHPITGPTLEAGEYTLYLDGASKWCPPLRLLDRLSRQYPELDFYLSATTEHEQHEEWAAKDGKLTVVEMDSTQIPFGIRTVYVRHGVELDPPEFEADIPGENEDPSPFTAEELVTDCQNIYEFFYPGRECPGTKSGALLAKAEEFAEDMARKRANEKGAT